MGKFQVEKEIRYREKGGMGNGGDGKRLFRIVEQQLLEKSVRVNRKVSPPSRNY
jgi:hypothetical protein